MQFLDLDPFLSILHNPKSCLACFRLALSWVTVLYRREADGIVELKDVSEK